MFFLGGGLVYILKNTKKYKKMDPVNAKARAMAHIRAAGHYGEGNPRKAAAHYKRAMHYSAFGTHIESFSLRTRFR